MCLFSLISSIPFLCVFAGVALVLGGSFDTLIAIGLDIVRHGLPRVLFLGSHFEGLPTRPRANRK